ncbi:MAG: GGDEF domain-containing protein [Spiribacter salinus]|uniref:diguanylate cyclase n=1 Tax=Spiribacter salinus TaxID=1335746 RepID=A0A540VRM9_9GAMM|nr:MAG: GGDEF domain-containing protein [Spiribacter salinus]
MSLGSRFIWIAVALVLGTAFGIWQVFDRVATGVIEQWGTRVAEVQVRYDSARLLQPLEREIALAHQMADSPVIQNLARDPDDDALDSAAKAEMERFRRNFGAKNYFVALKPNGAYYFNNADDEYGETPLRYRLSLDDPDDAWFYRLIEQGRDFHLNVNPDSELGVIKLWIDVLMRDPESDEILGVVGTGLELESLLAETVAVDQPGITTIFVDHSGAIQLYRDRDLIDYASLVKPEGQKSHLERLVSDPESRANMGRLLEQAQARAGNVHTAFVMVDGQRHLMGVAWLPRIGWYEVTMLDLDVIMPVSRFVPLLIIVLIVLVVSIFLLHFAVQRLLLRPISALESAMQALKTGRYVRGDLPAASGEMARLVRHFSDMANTIQEHTRELEERVEERTAELNRLARIDSLTELPNRRGMQEALEQTRERAEREGRRLSLLWIDVDEFKEINDMRGHETGDVALRQVAVCMRHELRSYDAAGRWGGDEFLVMLYPSTEAHMEKVAERLRAYVEANVAVGGQNITVSVGGYCAEGTEPVSQILARADRALYRAKEAGRNRVCLYTDER